MLRMITAGNYKYECQFPNRGYHHYGNVGQVLRIGHMLYIKGAPRIPISKWCC